MYSYGLSAAVAVQLYASRGFSGQLFSRMIFPYTYAVWNNSTTLTLKSPDSRELLATTSIHLIFLIFVYKFSMLKTNKWTCTLLAFLWKHFYSSFSGNEKNFFSFNVTCIYEFNSYLNEFWSVVWNEFTFFPYSVLDIKVFICIKF